MSTNTDVLFQPLKIGDHTVKNRIWMAALTRNRATDTVPTDLMKEHYVQRSEAGLIVTEATLVTRLGTEWEHAPGIWDRETQVPAWKKITDAVHAKGTKIYMQLWHVGRVAHPDAPQQKLAGEPVWSASSIVNRSVGRFRFLDGIPGCVEANEHPDPQKLVELFRQGAVNAKEAGFDGVEVHGANGYLISQFIDSGSNQRTDKWGGSIENRARFALEVTKACKEVFGRNVSFKLSPANGYNDMGMPLQETLDQYRYLVSELDKLDLAYINVVRYTEFMDVEIDGRHKAAKHDVVASYRDSVKSAPYVANAEVGLPGEAVELVSSKQVDAVSIGMNWIPHPDLVRRVKYGKPFDNLPDYPHLQLGENGDLSVGYTTYPEAKYD